MTDTCQRCGRPLSNPVSKRLGYGPICRRKLRFKRGVIKRASENKDLRDWVI